jgi:ABC-type transporter MlaC component
MIALPTRSLLRAPLAAGAFALLLLTTTQAPPAAAAQGPTALVTYVGTQGIQALDGSSAERAARLSRLFQQDFDVYGLGNFALGRYRAMATPQEMQEFYRVYPAFMVKALNYKLDDYRGQAFRVTGKRKLGGETIIGSNIGGRVQLDWHLAKFGPSREYRIADVTIGGVSMKFALRDQFASWIQSNGGQFSALLAVMRQQIAQLQ